MKGFCYLGVSLEFPNHRAPNHQFNISLVIDDDFSLVDGFLMVFDWLIIVN